jgi:hypothetical protein
MNASCQDETRNDPKDQREPTNQLDGEPLHNTFQSLREVPSRWTDVLLEILRGRKVAHPDLALGLIVLGFLGSRLIGVAHELTGWGLLGALVYGAMVWTLAVTSRLLARKNDGEKQTNHPDESSEP